MAIVILSIAIIPLFTMFDTALRSADTSSDYDRARTFANQKLEQAKNTPYEDLADRFPLPSGAFDTYADGSERTSSSQDADGQTGAADASGPYPGITYTATKQYVKLNGSNELVGSNEGDEGLIKVTVTAIWNGGTTYSTTTVVSR